MGNYGFVYLWRDRKHKRYYLGSHWGTEDDGYICSSRWMRNAYKRRPKDFKRRILKRIYTSKSNTFNEEYAWLKLIKKEELGSKYYNLKIAFSKNHWQGDSIRGKTIRQKISETLTGRKLSEEDKRNKSIAQKLAYKEGRRKNILPMLGKKHSEETLKKMRESAKKRGISKEQHKKMIQAKLEKHGRPVGEKNSFYGKKHTPESLEKMRIAHKKRYADPTARLKLSEAMKLAHKNKDNI